MPEFKSVRGVIRHLEKFSSAVVSKITLDITANLIEDTPVKTGWARANWVPSLKTPKLGGTNISKADPGMIGSSVGAQIRGQVVHTSGSYKIKQGPVFISNGVPYIEKLNSGSSNQSPSGFVPRAIEKAISKDIKVGLK